jgi:Helix-turn-helix of DDE superfamily endonuclease/DDE superfamily endonuclease
MLSYTHLKDHPREFLAATSLTLAEFLVLLPVFERVYETLYPPHLTGEGQTRRRRAGGGVKGGLARGEDKLWFILVYQKTNPLQTLHGLQFGLSQGQANYWIHRLLPVLQGALRELGMAPERDAERVETRALAVAGTQAFALDGTERRRQRPQDAARQTAHYSGKTKAHTDKNLLLVNESTRQVIYLSPTVAGTTHDKRAADEAQMTYPTNATLDKDTGFQGYEPIGVQTRQPKKNPRGKPLA